MDSESEKHQTLRTLYPIFKREVYERRDRIMKIALQGSIFLTVLLILVLTLGPNLQLSGAAICLLSIAVTLFVGLSLYQIIQQKNRHAQAKQAVIDIEQALGLFETGTYLKDRALYPPRWEKRRRVDTSILLYAACLVILDILVVLALLSTHSP